MLRFSLLSACSSYVESSFNEARDSVCFFHGFSYATISMGWFHRYYFSENFLKFCLVYKGYNITQLEDFYGY